MYASGLARIVVLFLLTLMVAVPAVGQSQAERERALRLIRQFADHVCLKPRLSGGALTVEGNAEISAELNGLVRKLVDAKGAIGAQAKKVKWDGVAQADLARAIESANKCSTDVVNLLVPRFIPDYRASVDAKPPAVANAKAKPPQPRYGAQNRHGVLVWRFGVHSSIDECLQNISRHQLPGLGGEVISNNQVECSRLAMRPVCSYQSTDSGPAYPVCYSTMDLCKKDIDRIRAGISQDSRTRLGDCEEIDFDRAKTQYDIWADPAAHRNHVLPVVTAVEN